MLVVSGRRDGQARALVERWSGRGARLLTCEDLSAAGWRYSPGHPEDFVGVVGGRTITEGGVTGVLTRLPRVFERELGHIAPEERR
jgi:hypothetical protein